jgi:VWFA-related protein
MKRNPLVAAAFVGVFLLVEPCRAPVGAQTAPPRPVQQSYQAQVTAVLVDVVVRDKRGRPVTDLTAADFEIREDGVIQRIDSFTLVNRGTGLGISVRQRQPSGTTAVDPTSAPGEPSKPADPPAFTALVFDALTPEALRLSQQAALGYLPLAGESTSNVGVFTVDPAVRVVQGYTADLARVRAGIELVSTTGSTQKEAVDQRRQLLRERQRDLDRAAAASPTTTTAAGTGGLAAAGASSEIGRLEIERKVLESEMRTLRSFEELDRDHRGYGTSAALMTVLQSLAYTPGRKAIVFFSEGLPVSPAMRARLDAIVETANRSNITVYTVDASGLRARSNSEETYREMSAVVEERLRQTSGLPEPATEPLMRSIERTEDLLRLDPQGGLTLLAEDTGGFLIKDTNDLRAGIQRIDEDSRFHYLLTYSPKNESLDGRFRAIDVKVGRPGVNVFSRKGYRAVPRTDTSSSYEAPAVALLDGGRLPNTFPVWAKGFVFPDPRRPGLVPIVVKVDTSSLRFDVDAVRSTYSAQAAVVVRVKDSKGGVVQKLSQQYLLSGDAKDLETAKQGEIIFYREPELTPGLYQMESIVYDGHAKHGSARVSTLTVPAVAAAHLRMSSVLVVAKTEQVPGAEATSAPLYYGDLLLYPNLGEAMERTEGTELMFYFVAYPTRDRPRCEATVELVRNGRAFAEAPLTFEPLQADGRVHYVGRLPVSHLPAGTYELRVNVTDQRERQTESTFFTMR